MSKPLEMPIHPKLKWPRRGSEIEPYRKQWKAENALRLGKRFTDSELAAEYWHARHDYEVASSWATADKVIRQASEREDAMARFVMNPSYDEAES